MIVEIDKVKSLNVPNYYRVRILLKGDWEHVFDTDKIVLNEKTYEFEDIVHYLDDVKKVVVHGIHPANIYDVVYIYTGEKKK
jgi:hypothetical protein